MPQINSFQGEYRFLSNFWFAKVTLDGVVYPSVEHAYCAAKTLNPVAREIIKNSRTPGEAKRMGRSIEIRPDWDDIKIEIMTDLVTQKFTKHIGLAHMLVATGNAELIEGNTWNDMFWGVCRGKGENHLGRILMAVRDHINLYPKDYL